MTTPPTPPNDPFAVFDNPDNQVVSPPAFVDPDLLEDDADDGGDDEDDDEYNESDSSGEFDPLSYPDETEYHA